MAHLYADAKSTVYQHNPYQNVLLPYSIVQGDKQNFVDVAYPTGTVHAVNLAGYVEYFPYPERGFLPNDVIESPFDPTATTQERLFVGQLNYDIDDSKVQWIASQFGGCTVHNPERIVKKNPSSQNNDRQLTGCLHVYVAAGKSPRLMEALNKRILLDRTGVWYASNDAMKQVLRQYCQYLKSSKTHRLSGMPYDTVNIELATSTFQPRLRSGARPSDDAFAAACAPFVGSRSRTPSPPPFEGEYYAAQEEFAAAPPAYYPEEYVASNYYEDPSAAFLGENMGPSY